jgi:hypothetical protein
MLGTRYPHTFTRTASANTHVCPLLLPLYSPAALCFSVRDAPPRLSACSHINAGGTELSYDEQTSRDSASAPRESSNTARRSRIWMALRSFRSTLAPNWVHDSPG